MEITGEHRIPAPRDRVWAGLNDPDILRRSIPGCESVERESETEFTARMVAKIGPVKARFESRIELSNIDAPNRYTITGEGKGGPAGFGKGGADVSLEEQGEETVLRYTAKLQVGGKLAQIGSRMVGGTLRKLANSFFSRFSEVVGQESAG